MRNLGNGVWDETRMMKQAKNDEDWQPLCQLIYWLTEFCRTAENEAFNREKNERCLLTAKDWLCFPPLYFFFTVFCCFFVDFLTFFSIFLPVLILINVTYHGGRSRTLMLGGWRAFVDLFVVERLDWRERESKDWLVANRFIEKKMQKWDIIVGKCKIIFLFNLIKFFPEAIHRQFFFVWIKQHSLWFCSIRLLRSFDD